MHSPRAIPATFALLATIAGRAEAEDPPAPPPAVRQSLDDAWWTGPMLAPSAATLPPGHFLVEPYLYDVIVRGRFDTDGVRRSTPHSSGFGSLTYVLYGLANRLTTGLIGIAGYNTVSGSPSSSGVGLGDITLQAQYRLTQFHEGGSIPTISIAVQETIPTGRYDRLGERPSDGFGGGAYSTTLALYSQTYFWLPNGRILRMRFNASETFFSSADVRDVSVYGTEAGFRGDARPGRSLFLNLAGEYSLTRKWVLALDVTYRHDGSTRVAGYDVSSSTPSAVRLDSGSSDAFGLAPAIEYNWKPNLGVLVGARVILAGRNTAATITPAVAVNFVR
jgi:Putative MetA-pathway of phenol degradation